MTVVGVASIRVRPDLTEFRKELKAELNKINPDLTVQVHAETRKAKAEVDAFVARESGKDINKRVNIDKNSLKQADQELSKIGNTVSSLGGSVKGIGIGAGLLALPGVLHTLIPLLASAASSALLIPGALFSVIAVVGTIALGIDGIKNAFNGLNPVLHTLRDQVSASFEKSLTPAVNNLKQVIPQLRVGFQSIATAIGGVATKISIMLKSGNNAKSLNTTLVNVSRGIQNLGKVISPIIQAFINLAKIGSEVFVELTAHIGTATQRFADFTGTAAGAAVIREKITGAIDAFKTLGDIVKTIGSIIGGVFSGLAAGGGGGNGLVSVLHSISDAIHSIQGQTALAALGRALSALGASVAQTVGPAFKALFGILTPVFNFIADHANIFGPILVAFAAIKLGAPAVGLAIKGIGIALEILSINPIILLVGALVGLLAATGNLQPVIDGFKHAWELISPVLNKLVQAILPPLRDLFERMKPVLEGIGKVIGKVIEALAPFVKLIIEIASVVLPPLIKVLEAVVFVIGKIVDVIGFAVDALAWFIKNVVAGFEAFGRFLAKPPNPVFFDGLKKQVSGTGGKDIVKPFTDAINRGIFALGNGPESEAAGKRIIDGITLGLSSGAPKAKSVFAIIAGDVAHVDPVQFATAGQLMVGGLAQGLQLGVNGPTLIAKNIADMVIGVFHSRDPDYAIAGANITKLFADGITAEQQTAVNAGVDTIGKVFFGFKSRDPGFTFAGVNIVDLFNAGMNQEQQAVVNQAIAIIDRVLGGWKSQDDAFNRAGQGIVDRFTDGVASKRPTLESVSAQVLRGVTDAFSRPSLFGAGQVIMDSLINGLNSKRGGLSAVLSAITSMIPAGKGPPKKDAILLKPAGELIMDGLINAIVSKQRELQSTLNGVTDQLTTAFDPNSSSFNTNVSAQLGASVAATGTFAPTPVIVNVNTDAGVLKDFVTVQIAEDNRDTRRKVVGGVNP